MSLLPRSFITECGWLKTGDSNDAWVVSSRIRLARNIEGIPFSQWASSTDLKRISDRSLNALNASPHFSNAHIFSMEDLDAGDRQFLAERYTISRELAKSGIERYAAINPDQTVSVMINEEDHLRLQVLMTGSNLRRAWDAIETVDDDLERELTFSFSNSFGYLTACPTNVGSGIRCSVMVHLPALMMTRRIEKVLNAVTQIGLTARGLSGEGSEIAGNLFQISNQWTLGISEIETIEKIEKHVQQILEQERKTEEQMMEDNPLEVEDKVWRAFAALKYAKVISSNEAVELLSSIRLGRSVGILKAPSYDSINEMLIHARPAHLQKRAERELSTIQRDEYRAEIIRQWIAENEASI